MQLKALTRTFHVNYIRYDVSARISYGSLQNKSNSHNLQKNLSYIDQLKIDHESF